MELKEFSDICITKASEAVDRGEKEEAIRLLDLLLEEVQNQRDKLFYEKTYNALY